MTTTFHFLLALTLALTGTLSACGRKDQGQATGKTAETASAVEQAPAATPAAAKPAAVADAAMVAAFDISTAPVTSAELGRFPYLGPLKGYSVNTTNSEEFDFERSYVYDGKNLVPVEGKVSQRLFDMNSGEKKASELMIQRNYEDLLRGLGAVKVHSDKTPRAAIDKIGSDQAYKQGKWVLSTDHVTDTYVIRQKNKEVWTQVTSLGSDGQYAINVTERAAMPQQATIMKADELKIKLATQGHIALYLNFDSDKATLQPDAQPTLAEVQKLLSASPDLRLTVQGHTDNTSTPTHNQQLSAARAAAVVAVLTAQGIAAGRLQAVGFGQTRPLADNATEVGRATNRRVELVKR